MVLEKTGTSTTFYLHGPGIDDLLGRKVGVTWTYDHSDGLGSVAALTDSAGLVLRSYAYEPFGSIRKTTGTTANAWTFTGRPLDSESSLLFLRNRYYDARTGTFLQQDPIGVAGGINLYAYVRNNPLNLIDPLGLSGDLEIQVDRGDGTLTSGHTWIEFTSDQTGERHTYGTWGREELGLVGLQIDIELNFNGDVSRTTHITDVQESRLFAYIESQQALGRNVWNYLCNCSEFSQEAWNRTTGDNLANRNALGIPNPNSLADSIEGANQRK